MASSTASTRELKETLRESQLKDVEEVPPEQTTEPFPVVFRHGEGRGEARGQVIFTLYDEPSFTVEVRSVPHREVSYMPSISGYEFRNFLDGLWLVQYDFWRQDLKFQHEVLGKK